MRLGQSTQSKDHLKRLPLVRQSQGQQIKQNGLLRWMGPKRKGYTVKLTVRSSIQFGLDSLPFNFKLS